MIVQGTLAYTSPRLTDFSFHFALSLHRQISEFKPGLNW